MKNRQSGATAVEFALVLLVFLMFLLGILDFSRMLYTWNAATEATRYGARYAVVCDDAGANADEVLARMQRVLPQIESISLEWLPAPGQTSPCTAATCAGVTVSVTNLDYQWISPIPGIADFAGIRMPSFSTFLPREAMRQDLVAAANVCRAPT